MMTKNKIPAKKTETEEKIPYKKWNIKTGWIIVGYLNKEENGK